MPINDPTQVQFYTGYDTFKNFDSASETYSVPATSYGASDFNIYTWTIPLEKTRAATQILHNFSYNPTRYYYGNSTMSGTGTPFAPTADFIIDITCSFTATTLTVRMQVLNADIAPPPRSCPAFTVTTTVKRFVTPFE